MSETDLGRIQREILDVIGRHCSCLNDRTLKALWTTLVQMVLAERAAAIEAAVSRLNPDAGWRASLEDPSQSPMCRCPELPPEECPVHAKARALDEQAEKNRALNAAIDRRLRELGWSPPSSLAQRTNDAIVERCAGIAETRFGPNAIVNASWTGQAHEAGARIAAAIRALKRPPA